MQWCRRILVCGMFSITFQSDNNASHRHNCSASSLVSVGQTLCILHLSCIKLPRYRLSVVCSFSLPFHLLRCCSMHSFFIGDFFVPIFIRYSGNLLHNSVRLINICTCYQCQFSSCTLHTLNAFIARNHSVYMASRLIRINPSSI